MTSKEQWTRYGPARIERVVSAEVKTEPIATAKVRLFPPVAAPRPSAKPFLATAA